MTDTTAGEGVLKTLADDLCEHRLYRTQYLVLPRLAIAAMPVEWQARLEQLLCVADEAGMENPSYVVLRNEPEYVGTNLSDPDDEYSRADSYDLRSSDPWADYRRGDALELSPGYDVAKAEALTKALAAQPSAGAQGEDDIWPQWAETIRKKLASYGVEPDDEGWSLAEDFEVWIDGVIEAETARAEKAEAELENLRATPAQPDTGDVAALRNFAEYVSSQMHNLPRSATADNVNDRALSILAALSKPNTPGREG